MKRKSEKMEMKILKTVFSLVLPAMAVCLLCVLASPDAMCADDDEFLISLPTDKPEKKPKDSASTKSSASKNAVEEQMTAVRLEDKLPGVIYDLRQTAARRPTNLLERQDIPDAGEFDLNAIPFLKKFISGDWARRTDSKGNVIYPDLNGLNRSSVMPCRSFFYQPDVSAPVLQRDYTENTLSNPGWLVIHSGYVVAPFTGKFRFVGSGDDELVVRFNRQIVLDFGWFPLSLGKYISTSSEYNSIIAQRNKGRLLPEKDPYDGKLEVYFPNWNGKHGVAKGPAVNVVKGRVYPIDILYFDIVGGSSLMALFIERLDSSGNPLKKNPAKLPLFRTTSELPSHTTIEGTPDFDDNSPIWKVVDSKGNPIPSGKYSGQVVKTVQGLDSSENNSKASGGSAAKSQQVSQNADGKQSTAVYFDIKRAEFYTDRRKPYSYDISLIGDTIKTRLETFITNVSRSYTGAFGQVISFDLNGEGKKDIMISSAPFEIKVDKEDPSVFYIKYGYVAMVSRTILNGTRLFRRWVYDLEQKDKLQKVFQPEDNCSVLDIKTSNVSVEDTTYKEQYNTYAAVVEFKIKQTGKPDAARVPNSDATETQDKKGMNDATGTEIETTKNQSPKTDKKPTSSDETSTKEESTTKKTDSSESKQSYNPFGYTQPLPEDE